MDEQQQEKFKKLCKLILKDALYALITYACAMAIYGILSGLFVMAGNEIIKEFHLDMRYVFIAATLPLPFATYSIARAAELYDREAQLAYAPEIGESYLLFPALKRLFTTPTLLRKLIVHSLVWLATAIVMPYSLGYRSVVGCFYPALDMTAGEAKGVLAATVLPALLLIILLAKTSAHKWWVIASTTERERILNHPHPRIRFALEVGRIFLIYSLSFLALPTVIMIAISFALTVAIFKNPRLWITLGVIILSLIVISYLSALISRAKFYKRVRKALTCGGYTLLSVSKPRFGAVIPTKGATLVFEYEGRRWGVKLMGARKRRRPVYLAPSGVATTRRTVGIFKMDLFHIMTDEYFGFEFEGDKIVVYSPTPKSIYANFGRTDTLPDDGDGGLISVAGARALARSGGSLPSRGVRYRGPGYVSDLDRGIIKPLSSGDLVGEYKYFTPDGFISAVENHVLHR